MKNKASNQLSPFMNKLHLLGRLSSLLFILVSGGVGVAICAYFDFHIDFSTFLSTWAYVFVIIFVSGLTEFAGALPILGSGATYISFITGNVSSMKLPAVSSAMAASNVERGTEEHEVLSIIAASVSSLLVIAAITVVILFTDVFQPILEWAPIQPAFTYIMPAICGLLAVAPLTQAPKILLPTLLIGCATVVLTGNNTMTVMFVCVIVALALFFLFSRNTGKEQQK